MLTVDLPGGQAFYTAPAADTYASDAVAGFIEAYTAGALEKQPLF
jgi:hypothetical protein